jgi:hypothetical protein
MLLSGIIKGTSLAKACAVGPEIQGITPGAQNPDGRLSVILPQSSMVRQSADERELQMQQLMALCNKKNNYALKKYYLIDIASRIRRSGLADNTRKMLQIVLFGVIA